MGFNAQSVWCFLSPRKKASQKRNPTQLNQNWSFLEEVCHRFSLAEIRAATQCFNDSLCIDAGGFGSVYKGYINNGATVVAIKGISNNSLQGAREFTAEVHLLCQLHHPNLISLIGFCEEEREFILVYDYMPNGSLYDRLFTSEKDPLSWKQRLNICLGVARAIHYLHTGVKHAVIHRDLKSSNILLDEKLEAKLSDFGLSKMGSSYYVKCINQSELEGGGYNGVLLEVLCAKPCSRELRRFPDMLDPFLIGKIAPDCLRKYMEIMERCICYTGAQRPTMGEVQVELEFALGLQESADTCKLKKLGAGTCVPAPALDYTYQEISFSQINNTFSVLYRQLVDSNGSVGLDSNS